MPNDAPAPPPPPQPVSSSQDTTAGGEVTTGEVPDDTTNALTQITLDLLAVLPSLL